MLFIVKRFFSFSRTDIIAIYLPQTNCFRAVNTEFTVWRNNFNNVVFYPATIFLAFEHAIKGVSRWIVKGHSIRMYYLLLLMIIISLIWCWGNHFVYELIYGPFEWLLIMIQGNINVIKLKSLLDIDHYAIQKVRYSTR